jgi:uncharacterized protein YndB with AHSA1/START domain
MLELDAQARSSAPPERVWALLVDVSTWPEWADFDEAAVESGSGVTLTPKDGPHFRWHSTFYAKVPGTGWLVRRTLQRFVADTAERLAQAAEQL